MRSLNEQGFNGMVLTLVNRPLIVLKSLHHQSSAFNFDHDGTIWHQTRHMTRQWFYYQYNGLI